MCHIFLLYHLHIIRVFCYNNRLSITMQNFFNRMLKRQYTTKSGFSDSSIWFFLYILCCLVQYLHELLRELFMVTVSTSSCIASIVFIISVRQRIIKRYLTSPPDSIQQTNMGLLAFQIVCLEFSAEVLDHTDFALVLLKIPNGLGG